MESLKLENGMYIWVIIINFKKLPQEQIDTVRKNARVKIEQQFTVDAMVKGMEELYWEVLNAPL